MEPEKVVPYIVSKSGRSTIAISDALGRSRGYLSAYIANKRTPNIRLLSELGNELGYDLLMRNRETGDEFIIDPPKEEDDEKDNGSD